MKTFVCQSCDQPAFFENIQYAATESRAGRRLRFPRQRRRTARSTGHASGLITITIDSLNRSMGQQDPYPFVLPQPAIDKMAYVHRTIRAAAKRS